MLSFESDYNKGAHSKILERIAAVSSEANPGYGTDKYCDSAEKKIKKCCNCMDADVYFLVGGTQVNQVVIASMLKGFEGVIAAETGHVSIHEAGAIEYTGHKVLSIPGEQGKINPKMLKLYLEAFYADGNHDHMVFPGMVYISYPTEYGTLYSLNELTEISGVCRQYNIPLYIDGARLGYGLMSNECDLTMADIAALCDVFYIGGTKVGALFGEAVVFTHANAPEHFMTTVKQHGALLAKGAFLGLQFDTLFTDNLYFEISAHAIKMADEFKKTLIEKGYRLFIDSPTNQIFVVLDNDRMEELGKHVSFSFWEKADDEHTVVRFATSWSTTREDMDALKSIL